jgi:glycosyltransferase involved in cell wall biosynthesis
LNYPFLQLPLLELGLYLRHKLPTLSTRVGFFFRKPRTWGFSIESLFDNLSNELKRRDGYSSHNYYMPSYRSVFKNIFYSKKYQEEVNHITGDIHYVALGLPRENTVLTIHDCVFLTRYSKWDFKYWLIKWIWYKWPVQSAAIVTVISEKTKKEVARLIGKHADKIQVVPNFYDPRFSYVPKAFNASCPRILQIGTKKNKNIARLAEALKGIPCELHIVGEIESDDLVLLEQNKIHYIAYVGLSFEELKEQYELCDMVVFASIYEGFGLPILEASAVGRPLVTSCISPMNEIAGEAACRINPYNIFDIRRGILKVIEDPEYRNQLIENAKQIREKYSLQQILSKYIDLYDQLIKK